MVGSDSGTPPIACNPALRSSLCGPFLVYIKPSLSTACIGIPPASEPREPRDHRTDGHTENQPAGPGCGQNFTDCVEQVVDECQVTEVHETLLSENRLRAGGQRRDASPGVLFRLPLQLFRRVREKTKEDRATHCDNDAAHLASLIGDRLAPAF